jgi:release factor glutamine methyltransferase
MMVPQGARILELGTGTGVIAAVAARYANRVIATDINPFAVKCAKATMRLNQLEDVVEVEQGDLFAPVRGQRFDLILFNPPYLMGLARNLLAQAWYAGNRVELIERVLNEARQYLVREGTIQILFSSVAPLPKIMRMIRSANYQSEILGKGRLFGFLETLYLFQLR